MPEPSFFTVRKNAEIFLDGMWPRTYPKLDIDSKEIVLDLITTFAVAYNPEMEYDNAKPTQ